MDKRINTIVELLKSNSSISSHHQIDELIRQNKIYIPKNIVDNWDHKEATLSFNECSYEIQASQLHNFYEIKANTVGPLFPSEYFSGHYTPRFLLLMKESFIEMESWNNNDRGGNNQIDVWKSLEYETHIKSISYIKNFLDELGIKYDNIYDVMKHICVVNTQLFPGLAFKSHRTNDKLLKPWAIQNELLITELIKYYDPQYILGGFTLSNYFKDPQKIKDTFVLGEKITDRILKSKNYYFFVKSQRVYIDAYHPSNAKFNPLDGKTDAKNIMLFREIT